VANVYVITDVPAETPVRIPDNEPMVATAVVPLLHVPPGTAFISVMLLPAQIVIPGTPDEPMGPGSGLTVTVVVTKQPVGSI